MNAEKNIDLIAQRLFDRYGKIEVSWSNPLEELITTILSQNTNDTNRDRAYRSLINRFRRIGRHCLPNLGISQVQLSVQPQ